MTAEEATPGYRDRFSIWELVVVVLIIGVGFGGCQFLRSLRGPVIDDTSVRQWIKQEHDPEKDNPEKAEFVREVEAFGSEAIPLFVRGLEWATNTPSEPFDWLGLKKKSSTSTRSGGSSTARIRTARTWMALMVLARKYPEAMNPHLTNLLAGSHRSAAIRAMGFMGDRHFTFLTNLIFTAHRSDARSALWGLPRYEPKSVSVLLRYLDQEARGDWIKTRDGMYALNWVGGTNENVLPALLERLESTNMLNRNSACMVLRFRTNQYAEIRPAVIEAAWKSMDAPQVRRSPVNHLPDFGVPSKEAVPILMKYLKKWIPIEQYEPHPTNVIQTLRILYKYGPDANEAVPLVEKSVLKELRSVASSSSAVQGYARSSVEQIEGFLRNMTR